jgi:peptidoglycan/LPS O-acetylase OafA/YrhL
MQGKSLNEYSAQSLLAVQRPSFISFLDFSRWFAAAIVFAGHLRNPMFLGYGALIPADRTMAVQVWYFITGWYGEAVVVFFVLSGFLVGGLTCAKAKSGVFSFSVYMVDRVSRLFIAFLPALLFTVILDNLGAFVLPSVGFYDHTHPMILEKVASEPFATNMTLGVFAANLAMLQTFFVPPYGSNQPLWTISAEFWFYVVFGAAMVGWTGVSGSKRSLGLVAAVLLTIVFGTQFIFLLGLWLVGVVAAFMPRALERPIIAFAVFLALLITFRLSPDIFKASVLMTTVKEYFVALAFAWLLVSMRSTRVLFLERMGNFNRHLADFSYSLYLIHFPMMLFVLAALNATGQFSGIAVGYRPTQFEGIALYVAIFIFIYIVAWVFSLITERNTGRLRRGAKSALLYRRLP